jgi:hypothetical protein
MVLCINKYLIVTASFPENLPFPIEFLWHLGQRLVGHKGRFYFWTLQYALSVISVFIPVLSVLFAESWNWVVLILLSCSPSQLCLLFQILSFSLCVRISVPICAGSWTGMWQIVLNLYVNLTVAILMSSHPI